MKPLIFITLLWLSSIVARSDTIIDMIKSHEGFISKPYIDVRKHNQIIVSIGYGINLTNGITEPEAELLLIHRVAIIRQQLSKYNWFNNQTTNRQNVLINMTYNLGLNGLLSFRKMIWCISNNYYNAAANELIKSNWYHQTGTRARYLVKLMREG